MKTEAEDFELNAEFATHAIVQSNRSWHLHEIALTTDYHLNFYCPYPNEKGPYLATLFTTDAFKFSFEPIDLRGDVPRQTAERLRSMAERLEQMAQDIETIPAEPFEFAPKAYVVRNVATNEVLYNGMLFYGACEFITAYEDVTNETAKMGSEPVGEHRHALTTYQNHLKLLNGLTLEQ